MKCVCQKIGYIRVQEMAPQTKASDTSNTATNTGSGNTGSTNNNNGGVDVTYTQGSSTEPITVR